MQDRVYPLWWLMTRPCQIRQRQGVASKSIPYFTFYPEKFMGGVRGMSAQEVGVYTMLLCRMYEEDGPVEYSALRLSTYCGMREKTFVAVAEKLIALGKITLCDGRIFNDRAAIEISDRADKLKNNSKAGKASAEKRQGNQGNASTPVQQAFNHKDKDKDKDKKEEAKASLAKRAQRLSGDWFLPKEWGDWSTLEGMTEDQVRAQAETFKDYWIAKAGRDAAKADWQATWRNWCRKFIADQKKGFTNGKRQPGINAAFGATINAIADQLSAGTINLDTSRSDPFAPRFRGNA
jgi:uncharacterized protein YdaU (DUF1376 family)